MEFPEFSKLEVCNLLMLHDDFESFDWTLISLRSLALALTLFPPLAGQVGTGCSKSSFSAFV
ncbi:hypothetical protein GTO10_04130 [Candidatus Saccharibacteria bacterium]|nr:hypothetical protein [Candidatus Saccharibacteria bacterium]